MKKTRLTDEDIQAIRYEKRTGYVFSAMIIVTGILGNVIYNSGGWGSMFSAWVNALILLAALLVLLIINRKYNKDLRHGERIKTTAEIIAKDMEIDYVSRIHSRKMKPVEVFFINTNDYKYKVSKEIYGKTKPGDFVDIYTTPYSNILLGITLSDK